MRMISYLFLITVLISSSCMAMRGGKDKENVNIGRVIILPDHLVERATNLQNGEALLFQVNKNTTYYKNVIFDSTVLNKKFAKYFIDQKQTKGMVCELERLYRRKKMDQ